MFAYTRTKQLHCKYQYCKNVLIKGTGQYTSNTSYLLKACWITQKYMASFDSNQFISHAYDIRCYSRIKLDFDRSGPQWGGQHT